MSPFVTVSSPSRRRRESAWATDSTTPLARQSKSIQLYELSGEGQMARFNQLIRNESVCVYAALRCQSAQYAANRFVSCRSTNLQSFILDLLLRLILALIWSRCNPRDVNKALFLSRRRNLASKRCPGQTPPTSSAVLVGEWAAQPGTRRACVRIFAGDVKQKLKSRPNGVRLPET
ncbi:hypothetical protein FISHEDRAFT_75665 [Fistulina hepatica ATCC 64428]|uniref:Uncharacterized protein n=1 Tax=Fistulina hepatica ATCC 64428 TaxID=1128425 RepID=A0A0D7A922_9AGAR|nr:hypothetical protein FISHEDRAFT_75665 [Fistulina hepatica ATCC 64428]